MEKTMTNQAKTQTAVPVALISGVLLAPIVLALTAYFTITHISSITPPDKAQMQRIAPVEQLQTASSPARQ